MTDTEEETRLKKKRNACIRLRSLLKRDLNREIDEVSKFAKLNPTIENVEQLEVTRLALFEARNKFNQLVQDYLELLDPAKDEDKKLSLIHI